MTVSVHTKLEEISWMVRQLIPSRMRMRLSSRRQEVGSITLGSSTWVVQAGIARAGYTAVHDYSAVPPLPETTPPALNSSPGAVGSRPDRSPRNQVRAMPGLRRQALRPD